MILTGDGPSLEPAQMILRSPVLLGTRVGCSAGALKSVAPGPKGAEWMVRFGEAIEVIHPRSLKHLSGQFQGPLRGKIWLQVMIGMILGLGAGVLMGPSVRWVRLGIAVPLSSWLALPGQLLLALIQMIVIPLIFAMIVGAALVTTAPKQSKPPLDLLGAMQELCLIVVR